MRFPPKSYNKDLESAEDRREREAQVNRYKYIYYIPSGVEKIDIRIVKKI